MTEHTIASCAQSMAGTLQSLCWASAAVGGVASSYFSGSLVQAGGPSPRKLSDPDLTKTLTLQKQPLKQKF